MSGPDGRVVLTAWIPDAFFSELGRLREQALAQALAAPSDGRRFAWHEPQALAGVFGPHGFSIELSQERLAFTADSPEGFIDSELRDHPLWIAARAVLEPAGELPALRERAVEIAHAANESPGGFRLTSHYVVVSARRP